METQQKLTLEQKRKMRIEQLEAKLAKEKQKEKAAAKREEAKIFLPLGKFIFSQIKKEKDNYNLNIKTEEGMIKAASFLVETGAIVFNLLRSLPPADAQHLLQQIAAKKPSKETLLRLQSVCKLQQ